MGSLNFKEFLFTNRLKHITIYVCTFLVIYFVLITALITKTYDIKKGDISKITIKAQRDIKDDISTKARIDEAISLIPPQYTIKAEVKDSVLNRISTLFLKTISLKDSNLEKDKKIKELSQISKIELSEEEFGALLGKDKEELNNLENFLIKTMSEIYDFGIQYNPELSKEVNDENIKKAQDTVQMKFNNSKFSKSTRDLGSTIGIKLIEPNSFYDKAKTEELKAQAIDKTPPVMVKKDQIIVMEGEEVTEDKYALLKSLGLINNNSKSEWYIYISLAVIIWLILFLESFYLYRYHKEVFKDSSKILLINIINCISLIISRTLSMVSPFLIPLAFAPMLIMLLINHKVSLTISILNLVLISAAVNFNIDIMLIAILNAVIGALIIQKLQQRNDILYCCIYIAIINTLATLSIGFLLSNNAADILLKAGYCLVGSCLSGILTVGLLPFFESAFDIVTTIKLLELSNPNSPLLKKLLMEAPGTYHHSVVVANLAEVAAEVVGGNPVFARVSSYYHDVGKIKRPYFFKENQIGNDNPHSKITPNLSGLIITSHVKDGLELAKDYRLPKVIQDIIEQHHGTSLVKYFYITAKNSTNKPEEIEEDDFKYPGPIPSSKEAGIVMLADSVEAAVRSISEPTQNKIEEMVNNIFKSRLNEGQLDNCDLTLKDINNIKDTFIKTLVSIYHQRIEYPIDKYEIRQKDKLDIKL
ncbi:HDIG domain-containing protein [Clostridium sp. SYSU_GA19001]|uniref:HD family phosphohydrolase n=1 Tax=Clostridium caldaquaticum TaxID=2940653 RepID=UPI002076E28C|nr:HDIG domain-containing metalloprotein [Clostridium caldaquaticum]MCM8710412.1 HDIG domain-containing protein [Clostridium caldaquaticum]